MAHLDVQLAAFRAAGGEAAYEYLATQNLVALQGPASAAVLARLLAPADAASLAKMAFMHGRPMRVLGEAGCIVTRCGYTGEDGFEVSMPAAAATKIAGALLEQAEVRRRARTHARTHAHNSVSQLPSATPHPP